MNKLICFISVFVVCLACYGDAFCQEKDTTKQKTDAQSSTSSEDTAVGVADANALSEPNSAVEGQESVFRGMEQYYQAEEREWAQDEEGRKPLLLEAVHTRWLAELEVLRKMARGEAADKTVAAIDELREAGNTRCEQFREAIREQKRKARFEQRRARKEQQRRRRDDARGERRRERRTRSRDD